MSERKAKRDSAEVPGQARHCPHRSVIADGRLDSGALERPRDFERISTAKVEREDPDARLTIDGALAIRHNPWHLGQPGVSVLGELGLPSGDRAQRGAQGVPAGGSAFGGGGPRGAAEIRPRGAAEIRQIRQRTQPAGVGLEAPRPGLEVAGGSLPDTPGSALNGTRVWSSSRRV